MDKIIINYILNLYFNLPNILNSSPATLYIKFITNRINKIIKDFYN